MGLLASLQLSFKFLETPAQSYRNFGMFDALRHQCDQLQASGT